MSTNPFKKNRSFWLGVIFTVIEGFLSASIYMTLYLLIDALVNDSVTADKLNRLTMLIAVIFIVRLVIYGFGYTQGQLGGGLVSKQLRLNLGDKFKKIPLGRFTQSQVGNYINTMTSDVKGYEQILTHKMGNIIKNISLSLSLLLYVCIMYLPAGIVLVLATLLFIPNLWMSFHIVKKYGTKRNAVYADTVSGIVEYITGLRTLRAYHMCGTKNKTLTDSLKEFSNVNYKYEAMGIPSAVSFNILTWLSLPVVMMVASKPFLAGELDGVNFLMVCMMPMLLAKMYMAITVDLFSYKNMMISKRNIEKIFDEPDETGNDENLKTKKHDICFKNVSFHYVEGEPVLEDVSFEAPDGGLTAIVGDSGSGKSTILNLISKYYEPVSGEILIGGKSIKNVLAQNVLREISMVDQDVFLFDDTIRENIRYARPDATDEQVENALALANCSDFVNALENGADTPAGENGNRLSGGERQRLSIARAILKDSPVLLLDEATASLDIENELAVKKAIANLLEKSKTVIMIAHTLSIVENADKIIVVSGGRIVESGTHVQLLKQNGKYAMMWNAEKKLLE